MIPTPRMTTTIKRDRSGLFAVVVIDHHGCILTTTLRPDIQASDLQVENLKRQIVHLPRIQEDA